MSYSARLRKVGGSVMLAIPPALLDALGLAPNAAVGLELEDGSLRLHPRPRPRYSLAELLSEETPASPSSGWLESPAKGRELL